MPVEVKEAFEDIKNHEMAKGREVGKAEGITIGKAEGITIGKIEAIVELLKKGLISEEVALSSLGLSKEELDQKIKELNI